MYYVVNTLCSFKKSLFDLSFPISFHFKYLSLFGLFRFINVWLKGPLIFYLKVYRMALCLLICGVGARSKDQWDQLKSWEFFINNCQLQRHDVRH